eukprot:CAMPEP_0113883196 /NCGR_PEP_ID=MMETSP0780_2-20120614/9432_1 /TAXON_ID=652834 /ORGANISM="Palpitomonas bilix" /LENGTH=379 /DNA_ID=CAMNT_0000870407 /DNA_START=231 /DNA_END=1367 /DNA_ORIENTATION=- /assembly_acc=CAM_ASM_000599
MAAVEEEYFIYEVHGETFEVPNGVIPTKLTEKGRSYTSCNAYMTVGPGQEISVRVRKYDVDRPEQEESGVPSLRALRALCFLSAFAGHHNIEHLIDLYKSPVDEEGVESIYIITSEMEYTLADARYALALSPRHHCFILYQIFRALKYIHSAQCIHRDINMMSIGVNRDCTARLLNFDACQRLADSDHERHLMTVYVGTRRYRSPEVLQYNGTYTEAADMFSLGCIMAELVIGAPLIDQGSDHDEMRAMLEQLLPLSPEDIALVPGEWRGHIHAESEAAYARARAYHQRVTPQWMQRLPHSVSKNEVDLLSKLLAFNPDKRISAEEALSHPYFAEFYSPGDEPTYVDRPDRPLPAPSSASGQLSKPELIELLACEVEDW